ncbi:hypothetical protein [Paractinoplanes maris]|uniref:hypothetical protein n=1 Tax=Paractinoplanes maris TaxID=1734446 RepID=UPI0020212110|nr:hypothetical protein [Actinoplanes maris]
MPDPKDDVVGIVAMLHHAYDCKTATKPYAAYSAPHRRVHENFAHFLLTGLADAGVASYTKEP